MVIRTGAVMDLSRNDLRSANIRSTPTAKSKSIDTADLSHINLSEDINKATEEMADLLSAFGRFSKVGKRNDSSENDFASSILEDKADEKLNNIIKNIHRLRDLTSFMNHARSLFPNDSDLMLAMRELLLSKKLSELQKKKIKESMAELDKFCDTKKMNSGINIAKIAKRYSQHGSHSKTLEAKDLRNSYLRFIEIDLPVSFIYQDWIDEFGCENRKLLLAFTLTALVADMKSHQPGIHYDEFGPLSSKLNDARIINTLDESLLSTMNELDFLELVRFQGAVINDKALLEIFFIGLTDFVTFKHRIIDFSKTFTTDLLIKQRAIILQKYRNIFNITPDFVYSTPECRDLVQEYMSTLMLMIHNKELHSGY